mmetsp:Transcript_8995/g.8029  ORF Transcript_8995/g.8029 Transcript_8995/m.8029 type:complete len:83 (-) Transcript_8995:109-357(-)
MSNTKQTDLKDADAQKEISALELLEEDDEFEEFEGTTWEALDKENEDSTALWQDDWDDDDISDEFTQQLRVQLDSINNELQS